MADGYAAAQAINDTSSAIAAVNNSLSQEMSNKNNREFLTLENEKNRQFAVEQSALKRRYDLEDRAHEENYNSPLAVRQRLESAGINPNLAYGSALGTPTSTNAWEVPTYKGEAFQQSAVQYLHPQISNYQSLENAEMQNKILEEQFRKMKLQNDSFEKWNDLEKNSKLEALGATIQERNMRFKREAYDLSRKELIDSMETIETRVFKANQSYYEYVESVERWSAQFQLSLEKFGLDEKRFNEQIRQFKKMYDFGVEKFNWTKALDDEKMSLAWSQFNEGVAEYMKNYQLNKDKYEFSKAKWKDQKALAGLALVAGGINKVLDLLQPFD